VARLSRRHDELGDQLGPRRLADGLSVARQA
jgi:hypothetical protein